MPIELPGEIASPAPGSRLRGETAVSTTRGVAPQRKIVEGVLVGRRKKQEPALVQHFGNLRRRTMRAHGSGFSWRRVLALNPSLETGTCTHISAASDVPVARCRTRRVPLPPWPPMMIGGPGSVGHLSGVQETAASSFFASTPPPSQRISARARHATIPLQRIAVQGGRRDLFFDSSKAVFCKNRSPVRMPPIVGSRRRHTSSSGPSAGVWTQLRKDGASERQRELARGAAGCA